MGHRFHAHVHGERKGYLFVKLSKADKRRRRKQRKLEESRPSNAELRERYAVRYAGGWPDGPHSIRSR
jgi:hypothetical protein